MYMCVGREKLEYFKLANLHSAIQNTKNYRPLFVLDIRIVLIWRLLHRILKKKSSKSIVLGDREGRMLYSPIKGILL